MNYSFLKSVGKAFKAVGLVAGSAAGVAGLAYLSNPAALAPILALGPAGPVLALAVQAVATVGLDYLKHRGDKE